MTEHSLKADLLLLLATLIAALGWLFSKEALAGLPPFLFIGIRFFLAGTVLLVLGWPYVRILSPGQLLRVMGVGVVMGFAMVFWVLGLDSTAHVGEGAFIASLGVILVPVVARVLFRTRSSLSTWLALPIAMLGLAMLSLNQGFRPEPAQVYFFTAAVIFAVHFNLNTRVAARVSPFALTAVQLAVAGLINLVMASLFESWPPLLTVSADVWGWVLASALIATSLRFVVQVKGQALASVGHAAIIMTLEPLWTAVVAALWLTESMTLVQFGGCALIFASLLVQRFGGVLWEWSGKQIA